MNREYEANDNHKSKRDELLLFILFALCFLLASFATTFSFYRLKTTNKPNPPVDIDDSSKENNPSSTTKIIEVVYPTGSEIAPTTSILPGWRSINKEIVITNASDVDLKYQLLWQVVKNDFVRLEDLIYHVNINGVEVAKGMIPTTDRIIINNVSLASLEKHNITIYVEYLNASVDQSVDMGHTFISQLIVKNVD